MLGGGRVLRGLSQWVQLYTGAQINFGDLTPYLTYGLNKGKLQVSYCETNLFWLVSAYIRLSICFCPSWVAACIFLLSCNYLPIHRCLPSWVWLHAWLSATLLQTCLSACLRILCLPACVPFSACPSNFACLPTTVSSACLLIFACLSTNLLNVVHLPIHLCMRKYDIYQHQHLLRWAVMKTIRNYTKFSECKNLFNGNIRYKLKPALWRLPCTWFFSLYIMFEN